MKFFVEEDLKTSLGWLGLNFKKSMKKRILKSVYVFLLIFAVGIIFKNLYICLFSLPLSVMFYKYLYVEIKKTRKGQVLIKRRMFPSFVKKLLILLRTNNIYRSLKIMTEFTDDPYKTYLNELVEEINYDKGINPYLNFSKKLEFDEATQIMLMIYTFTNMTKSDKHLISLDNLISKLYDNELEETIEYKKRMLWIYPNYTIITMLGLIFSLAIYMFIDVLAKVSF